MLPGSLSSWALRDSVFDYVCVVITVAIVMLLRDFGPYVFYLYVGWLVSDHLLLRYFGTYEIIFRMCVFTTLDLPVILDG
jgi:hypothetical protein